jgi:hypothetical protein
MGEMCSTVLDICDECIHICNDCFIKNKNIVQTRSIQTRSMTRAATKKKLANSEPPKFDWAKIDADAEAKMADEDEKEQRGINLCESGMGDLVYHLGFCSDVIGDCWIEHYYSGGVSGLKKQLRKSSEYVHKHGNCKECKRLIDGIHD